MKKPVLINEPIGIDRIVQECQIYLTSKLTEIEAIYGRAFRNETRDGKFIPEIYAGNNEYFEIFSTDFLKSHIFFDVDQRRQNVDESTTGYNNKFATNIKIIVSANLLKTYPELNCRASEYLINRVNDVMRKFRAKYATWELNEILEGTQNIFDNYNFELSEKKVNMQPYYIVAFDYNITYYDNIC